jgi:hypothetical protein
MNRNVRLTVVAALIAFHLAGDVSWPQGTPTPNDWLIPVGLGFSIAQVNLIAAWAALAPDRLMVLLRGIGFRLVRKRKSPTALAPTPAGG